jgi:hypothetical protein
VTASTIELLPPGEVAEDARATRHGHAEPSGLTLEELVLGAWEDLATHGRAECPVCREDLAAAGCPSCGSALN